jgi:hypothetical protein
MNFSCYTNSFFFAAGQIKKKMNLFCKLEFHLFGENSFLAPTALRPKPYKTNGFQRSHHKTIQKQWFLKTAARKHYKNHSF